LRANVLCRCGRAVGKHQPRAKGFVIKNEELNRQAKGLSCVIGQQKQRTETEADVVNAQSG